ncbi:MAG: winged helix DNA-binding protein, partial [Pseudomonadota bacterium]|nr:winged helix DNA-binding protein [Pseudomonadota bacterium]
LTVGELTLRGCYHGSNVSYNLKKLVDFGYVSHRRSAHDRRSYRVKLTDKGGKIRKLLDDMFARHAEALESLSISVDTLGQANDVLLRLDRFWASQSDAYGISDKALSRVAQ